MTDSMTLTTEPETNTSTTTANLNNHITLSVLTCILITGPMFFLLMPLYVGALADYVGLNIQYIGTLTSLELLGSCLASLSALFWIRKINWRKMATAGALASALGAGRFRHILYSPNRLLGIYRAHGRGGTF